MKRKKFKIGLWFILITIISIICVLLAVTGTNIPMQKENPETTIEVEEILEDRPLLPALLSDVTEDFSRFVNMTTDFLNVVVNNETSKYESGLDALFINDQNVQKSTEVELTPTKIVKCVDGDTIYVCTDDNTLLKVRLIGVDTPESVHPDESRNTIWGTYASDYTKTLLGSYELVYLEFDKEREDQYGRTLAYVWLNEDTSNIQNMLNAKLLSDGYAMDKVFQPNSKYADTFSTLRQEAENSGLGLWADEGFHNLWEG